MQIVALELLYMLVELNLENSSELLVFSDPVTYIVWIIQQHSILTPPS